MVRGILPVREQQLGEEEDSVVEIVMILFDPGNLFASCPQTQSRSSSSKVVCNTWRSIVI